MVNNGDALPQHQHPDRRWCAPHPSCILHIHVILNEERSHELINRSSRPNTIYTRSTDRLHFWFAIGIYTVSVRARASETDGCRAVIVDNNRRTFCFPMHVLGPKEHVRPFGMFGGAFATWKCHKRKRNERKTFCERFSGSKNLGNG